MCNQYRFDAVFIQKPLKAIVSQFKGMKPEEFMKLHKNIIENSSSAVLSSFITTSSVGILSNYSSNPILSAYSTKYGGL